MNGLEGVVVAETRLSEVDGKRGRLVVAGHDVEELADRVGFAELCAQLWSRPSSSDEPASDEASCSEPSSSVALSRRLGEARQRAFRMVPDLGSALRIEQPVDALRACLAHLSVDESDQLGAYCDVTGAVSVFTATWWRLRQGGAAVPDPACGHAADTLRMLRGEGTDELDSSEARAFERYLVTVADHGMNASTFTARVVASTGSDLVSSVVAALGALKGPLHGGAPGPVLDMLDEIGSAKHARGFLERELAAGRRIMGMGHRVYRVRDPRAEVLSGALRGLPGQGKGRLELAREVEREASLLLAERHPDRSLRANVEFYTAVLLEALGIPRALFTSVFAMGRVVGWCAHVGEQRAVGRLIRPSSRYVGPRPSDSRGFPSGQSKRRPS